MHGLYDNGAFLFNEFFNILSRLNLRFEIAYHFKVQ
jgi:hypothetical protein